MSCKLKIFTLTQFLTPSFRGSVFPLLFDLVFLENVEINEYYELEHSLKVCDIMVMPIELEKFMKYKSEFDQFLTDVRTNNKVLWYYIAGDSFKKYDIELGYEFRLSGFKSNLRKNTFIMPSFIDDIYKKYHGPKFKVLPKTNMPKIGFVGQADASIFTYLKHFLRVFELKISKIFDYTQGYNYDGHPAIIRRFEYLKMLENDSRVDTSIIYRKKYRAGVHSKNDIERTEDTFYENIINNLFTFCYRGAGNFSVRFYEVLSLGRIPILINTDCMLPFDDTINWNDHALILDENDDIVSKIIEFYNKVTEEDISEIQARNRMLWVSKLERISYFKNIHDIMIDKDHFNC